MIALNDTISRLGLGILAWHIYKVRFDRDAGADLLQSIDDHPLARLQTVGDRSQAVMERTQPDRSRDDLVVLVHDIDDLLTLIGVEGAVGNE